MEKQLDGWAKCKGLLHKGQFDDLKKRFFVDFFAYYAIDHNFTYINLSSNKHCEWNAWPQWAFFTILFGANNFSSQSEQRMIFLDQNNVQRQKNYQKMSF